MPVAAGQGEQEASGGGYAPAPSGKAPAAGPDRRDEPPRVSPGHGPFAEHRPAGAKQPSRTRLGAIRSAGCGAEAQAHAQSRPIGPHFRRERGCVDSGAGGGRERTGAPREPTHSKTQRSRAKKDLASRGFSLGYNRSCGPGRGSGSQGLPRRPCIRLIIRFRIGHSEIRNFLFEFAKRVHFQLRK